MFFTYIAVGAGITASLAVFADRFGPFPSATTVIATSAGAIVAASVVALLAAADVWLLIGSGGLTRRLVAACLINAIPTIFFIVGAAYGLMRIHEQGFESLVLVVVTQRLLTLFMVALLSCSLQYVCRRRIIGPFAEKTERRRRQASIGDVMTCTALVSAVLGCGSYWIDYSQRKAPPMQVSEVLGGVLGLTAVEVLGVLLYLLSPLLLAWVSPTIRRRYPLAVFSWVCWGGILIALPTMALWMSISFAEGFILCGALLGGHLLFAIAVYCVLRLALAAGFRIKLPSDSGNCDLRRPKPSVRAGCVGVVLLTVGFYAWFDVPVLIETQNVSLARRVAWMSQTVGRFPNRLGYQWGQQRLRFSDRMSVSFAGDETLLRRLVRDAVQSTDGTVDINLSAKNDLSGKVLNELQQKSIGRLRLACSGLEEVAFDEFCERSRLTEIEIESGKLEASHIRSLHKLKNLRQVELPRTLRFSDDVAKALLGLPLDSLGIQIDGDADVSFSPLRGLSRLTIRSAEVTAEMLVELGELGIKSLELSDCELDIDAMKALSSMRLDSLIWRGGDGTKADFENRMMQLADTPRVENLDLDVPCDELFVTQFTNRHSTAGTLEISGSGRYRNEIINMEGSLVRTLLTDLRGDVDAVLEKIATKLVRRDDGQIVELDLQEIPLAGLKLDELRQLQALQRLRLGHKTQSLDLFRRVARLQSLRSLEVSGYGLDDDALDLICELKNLTRLQLPTLSAVDYGACRHPERMPLTSGAVDTVWLAHWLFNAHVDPNLFAVETHWESYGAGYHGYADMDDLVVDYVGSLRDRPLRGTVHATVFTSITALTKLEYLFLPGHLLTEKTMGTLEQLPNLSEIHAPFSLVSPSLLDRIAKLRRLQGLSFGMRSITPSSIRSVSKLPNLRKLQITVFNSEVLQSATQQEQLRVSLADALPDCEVHLLFFGDLQI